MPMNDPLARPHRGEQACQLSILCQVSGGRRPSFSSNSRDNNNEDWRTERHGKDLATLDGFLISARAGKFCDQRYVDPGSARCRAGTFCEPLRFSQLPKQMCRAGLPHRPAAMPRRAVLFFRALSATSTSCAGLGIPLVLQPIDRGGDGGVIGDDESKLDSGECVLWTQFRELCP